MSRYVALIFAVLAGCGPQVAVEPTSNSVNLAKIPRHPISDQMRQGSAGRAGTSASTFTLRDTAKRPVTLSSFWELGPAVLVFTKDGCPCSIEAQPFMNALAKHFGARASFVGIIDSPPVPASKYADDFRLPYPLLCAPDDSVFRAYGAERSVYLTLVAQGGRVVSQWPGYSRAILGELNRELSQATGLPKAPIDLEMAPEDATSGCLLFGEVGE